MKRRGDTRAAAAEEFAKIEQNIVNRLLEQDDTYTVLTSLMLYFVKMDIARQYAVPTDGALADAVEVAAKYGFSVVTALAAARHQRHTVTEAFSDFIKRLSGETDCKKPDGVEYYGLQEPWEKSILM